MTTEATAKAFFSSPYFSVVGASSNPAKFGQKIFAWYIAHSIPATPINPGSSSIAVSGKDYTTVPTLSALPHPKETSVSIITPPAATLKVLNEAKELGIPAVWLQPGTFDDEVLKFAYSKGNDGYGGEVVAGDGGRGSEGWCVLVDGEKAMKAAGKL
ncbi:CoA binding domain-containing protein [Apiospora phragmitis]|uniref:CoA binding domain-containing protein n=1 Tax=Apiospora phragmitis TaxID=2905665 RepID=A0ABR1T788_9PEZI